MNPLRHAFGRQEHTVSTLDARKTPLRLQCHLIALQLIMPTAPFQDLQRSAQLTLIPETRVLELESALRLDIHHQTIFHDIIQPLLHHPLTG